MNIVVLAAGQGKRMISNRPKVLHSIAGKPFLSRVLSTAQSLNPTQVIVVLGHLSEQVLPLIPPNITVVYQDPPLGTGHAIAQAVPYLKDDVPTMVLYGDVPLITQETLTRMIVASNNGTHLVLLTQIEEDPTGYGRIVSDEQGQIQAIVEEKDATPEIKKIKEINTGFMLIPTPQLKRWLPQLTDQNEKKEFYLTDIVEMAAREQVSIKRFHPIHTWESTGVNDRIQQANLERDYQAYLANQLMLSGTSLADPARIDIRGRLESSEDVWIDVGCVFEGEVKLGKNCVIEANCILKNVTLGPNVRIRAFSHLEGAQVEESATIGPFARIRPETHIGAHAHVGNFVEMKKTFFGAHSKANHLSYVGDAIIGTRVNIGAGTITCNYDGVNKYQTIIGDNAFIGSDSQLVAPVKVGVGATIGAGTTLTKDAPDHQLTLSRAKQMTISSWKRPKPESVKPNIIPTPSNDPTTET